MRGFLAGWLNGVLMLPVLAVGVARLGRFHANASPSRREKAFAQMALKVSVARHAPHVANPIPATEENLLAGIKTFKDACAGCHGEPSEASDYGASFYPNVPQFSKDPPRLPDWQLFWMVRNGVRYSGMSARDGQWHHDRAVSDDYIWKVVTFLSHLDTLPPAVDTEWRRKTP